jgi:hypothetical protein
VTEIRLSKRIRQDIGIEFHRYLDVIIDVIPNATLFYIERKTMFLASTLIEINCCKKEVTTLCLFQNWNHLGYQEEGQ